MQIEKLQELVKLQKIIWSKHFLERMQERKIEKEDVVYCIYHGKIIEDYPNSFPYPSCLIYGNKINGIIIHVVVGCDEEYAYIITAYFPDLEKFETDFKTRRIK